MNLAHARSISVVSFTFLLVIALVAPSGASAAAKYKFASKVSVNGAETRLVVTLTSSKSVGSKYKPSKVSAKAAGKTLSLKKIKSPKTTDKYISTWQSSNQTGAYAEKLKALGKKKISVTAKARAGKVTKRTVAPLAVAPPAGGGTPGAKPLFPAPGKQLSGMEAWNYISPYFLNSAFSDCAAGPWPKCAVEYRYVHCPNFSWRYMRTSSIGSGSDINSYGSFTVSNVSVYADGSWAVEYTSNTGALYLWAVGTNGVAGGIYKYGGNPPENLGTFYWSQPATTWDYPSGYC